ncbi:hypothetical protein FA15DRAFT_721470 [Coprinopsis marcescibilis]|uniref:ditrans,polycis-polyprenyl diphosphate synthase [(2E,6E)-farnesyldiphosphate specific] n=1 Tax=Coprinopsis marcescibilis TaxID=230819 RepID=A0A5C3KIX9_COPMA|nr:hypothetical protein FA15DRAFT_721470 [Coprinopsis marcescibilis]
MVFPFNPYDRDIRCHLLEMSKDSTIDSDSSESEIEYRPLTPPPSDYSDSRPISPSQNTNPTIPLVKIVLSDSSNAKERPNRKSSLKRRTRGMEQGSTSASLTVCLMSHVASKSAIAAAASSLAKQHRFKQRKGKRTSSRTPFSLGVSEFEAMLEGEHGLSPPDFMIVHSFDAEDTHRRVPLELINFPPWHIRLTEIYQSRLGHIIGWPWKAPKSLCTAFPLDDISFREALDEFSGAEFRFGK